jgi:hypothetical protein
MEKRPVNLMASLDHVVEASSALPWWWKSQILPYRKH